MYGKPARLQQIVLILFISYLTGSLDVFARGSSAILSLRQSPSPFSNSLALTGAAISAEDAYSIWHNPAHSGIEALENNLVINFYPLNILMYRNSFDGWNYSNFAAIAGYNFGRDSSNIPLSIGIGMINQRMNLGMPKLDTSYHLFSNIPFEKVDGITVGACLDAGIRIAIGFTYKTITSDYYSWLMKDSARTVYKTDAADIGVIAVIPVFESLELAGNFRMKADASIGAAFTNIGGKINYQSKGEPLPRTAILAYALTADFGYKSRDFYYNLLKAEWTMEYEDYLVRMANNGIEYESIFSDINVIQNLILLKNPNREVVKYGAKFTLFNSLLLMIGNYNSTGPAGNDIFTIGYGIKLFGLLDYLAAATKNSLVSFIGRHFDLGFFYTSRAEKKLPGKPEYSRTYSAFTFSVKNFGF